MLGSRLVRSDQMPRSLGRLLPVMFGRWERPIRLVERMSPLAPRLALIALLFAIMSARRLVVQPATLGLAMLRSSITLGARLLGSIILAALALVATPASAHTTAFGYTASSTPGTYTFWFGTYHNPPSPLTEGSLQLVCKRGTVTTYSGTSVFTTSTNVKPGGLINDVNYFLGTGTGTGLPATFASILNWQGATFNHLGARKQHRPDRQFCAAAACCQLQGSKDHRRWRRRSVHVHADQPRGDPCRHHHNRSWHGSTRSA
jgi:hypothetical protein